MRAHSIFDAFRAPGMVAGLLVTLCGPAYADSTVWEVSGADARGNYTGKVELIATPAGYRFIRAIGYGAPVTVEDGRSLFWVWEGTAAEGADGTVDVSVDLAKADFIRKRGDLVRTEADAQAVRVSGHFAPAGGVLRGSFSGPDIGADETWSAPEPGGAVPIFEKHTSETPTHEAIPAKERDRLFSLFASYHALPEIQPYVNRPEFINPIHTVIADTTDFDFYRQHPQALRVVDKVIDPISLQETLARADAYKWCLAGKAAYYDQDAEQRSIDPATGMLFEWVTDDGRGLPSHDSALWTGAYVASQYLRYRASGDPAALANIVRSTEALLTLTEITGDRRSFARTLRKATGNPVPPWYAGTGVYAGLEWKAGGNNDMYKGLMYGLATAHALLCDQLGGYEDLCARLRYDVLQIRDNLEQAQGSGYNRLAALWLSAYITQAPGIVKKTVQEWKRQAQQLADGSHTVYVNGVADWSGTHLAAVQYLVFYLLADRFPLPDIKAKPVLRQGIEAIYGQFARVRMGLWSVPFARLGTAPHPDASDAARWRLRELPAPKPQLDIDHRIRPDYVMSPFPSAPWKFDWTRTDRTQSLRSYPMFEASAYTVYGWKQSPLEYVGDNTGLNYPGVDYLHAYWLGRVLGVFSAAE